MGRGVAGDGRHRGVRGYSAGQFVYDDDEAIVRNPHVRALWPLRSAMAAPPQSAVSGRPLVSLSLALNHAVGGLDPTGYHLWNIAVHAGVALLLYRVLRRTLRAERLPPDMRDSADGVAFTGALVWLVHPLNSEVVAYTVLRHRVDDGVVLSYAVRGDSRLQRGAPRKAWLTVSATACLLGAGCKESDRDRAGDGVVVRRGVRGRFARRGTARSAGVLRWADGELGGAGGAECGRAALPQRGLESGVHGGRI